MDDKDLRRLQRYEDWRVYSVNTKNYAVQRFDLLIIAIATTGIIIDLNILKVAMELKLDPDTCFKLIIKLSALGFALSILFNFISQLTSHTGHRTEEDWANEKIWNLEDKDQNEEKIEELHTKAQRFHKWTQRMNRWSAIALGCGFLLLAIIVTFYL